MKKTRNKKEENLDIDIEKFENNFYFHINEPERVDVAKFENAGEEEYFDEYACSFDFLIPMLDEKFSLKEISFSYVFDFFRDDKNKCEIVFKDENRPTINVSDYELSINARNNLFNTNYFHKNSNDVSFENFIADMTSKHLKNKFTEFNEKYFFDGFIDKKKVKLDKKLLSSLEKNFYSEITRFFENVKLNNVDLSSYQESNLDSQNINDLQELMKKTEIKFNYNKLASSLEINLSKEDAKKMKI